MCSGARSRRTACTGRGRHVCAPLAHAWHPSPVPHPRRRLLWGTLPHKPSLLVCVPATHSLYFENVKTLGMQYEGGAWGDQCSAPHTPSLLQLSYVPVPMHTCPFCLQTCKCRRRLPSQSFGVHRTWLPSLPLQIVWGFVYIVAGCAMRGWRCMCARMCRRP